METGNVCWGEIGLLENCTLGAYMQTYYLIYNKQI